jgi:circadian clock protein KaiC
MLAETPLRYRRQILALKRHFSDRGITSLFIDDKTGSEPDLALHSSAQGVFDLITRPLLSVRRGARSRCTSCAGARFARACTTSSYAKAACTSIRASVAAEHKRSYERESIESGIAQLDALLGGGLAKGTSTLVIGPAGTGKSSLATQFAVAAATRGEHAAIYLFDESVATFIERSSALGMGVEPLIDSGRISLRQIDPAELSPGEFAHGLRSSIENDKTQLVVIDSLNGYLNATPSEKYLTLHLHELLTYLGQCGATTLLLMTQHGIVGQDMSMPIDASYLADSVVFAALLRSARRGPAVDLRHQETDGQARADRFASCGSTTVSPSATSCGTSRACLSGFPRFVGDVAALSAARP